MRARTTVGAAVALVALLAAADARAFDIRAGGVFTVGRIPRGVAAADFNRDGKLDLAVANESADSVSVLDGNGTGGFAAARTYAVGDMPRGIVAADFDRDGKVDLATPNMGVASVSLLRGNGDGTFAAAVAVDAGAGTAPNCLVTGDFNRDGATDLAVGDYYGVVAILKNNGSGTLAKSASWHIGGLYVAGLAAADFNGDKLVDLAVLQQAFQRVDIFTGDGAGHFAPGPELAAGADPWAMAAGDFDSDGDADVAVLSMSGALLALSGSGDGSFTASRPIATGDSGRALLPADMDADGAPDLVFGRVGGIGVAAGIPAGPFGPAVSVRGWEPSVDFCGLAAGDFDRDGQPDIAAADGADHVQVFLNRTFAIAQKDTFASATKTAALWRQVTGAWKVVQGAFVSSTTATSLALVKTPATLLDGRLKASVQLANAAGNADLVFAWKDAAHYRYVRLTPGKVAVGQVGASGPDAAGTRATVSWPIKAGQRYPVQVDLYPGPEVRVLIGGRRILSARFAQPLAGAVGVRAVSTASRVDDFTIVK